MLYNSIILHRRYSVNQRVSVGECLAGDSRPVGSSPLGHRNASPRQARVKPRSRKAWSAGQMWVPAWLVSSGTMWPDLT